MQRLHHAWEHAWREQARQATAAPPVPRRLSDTCLWRCKCIGQLLPSHHTQGWVQQDSGLNAGQAAAATPGELQLLLPLLLGMAVMYKGQQVAVHVE